MRFTRILLIILIGAVSLGAYAPRRILTSAGVAFERWADSSFPIAWRLNSAAGQNITGERNLAELVRVATQAWTGAPTSAVSFIEGAPTNIAATALDQVNVLSFAPSPYTADAAALTVLYSFTQTGTDPFGRKIEFPGQILEADILFNPAIPFSTASSPPADRIDLQSQITHELGHLLGLDHSAMASSVMFPEVAAGKTHQRNLSTDDVAGISTLYPRNIFWTERAGARGIVRSATGMPVFGANVVIVDAAGKPVLSAITDPSGNYYVHGLEPGNYSAYAEPLDAPLGAATIVSLATAFPTAAVSNSFTTRFAVSAGTSSVFTLTKTAGDGQTAHAGQALPVPLEVQVKDSSNNPVVGALVNFSAASGGGAVVPVTAVTDSQGKARTTAYLGSAQNQSFTASAGSSTIIGFAASKIITISSITLIDPATSTPLKELTINAGNTVQANTRVLDSTAAVRNDVALTYQSTNPEVATVDSQGNIAGKKAGFTTLLMTGGGSVSTATITVVEVASGPAALETTAVAESASGEIYLAATADHTIRSASTLSQTPAVYAGAAATAGFTDGNRLTARFKNPAFLAVDNAGAIYVSDSGNHSIRKITPSADSVETLAGTGVAGSLDGAGTSATFNNPQGVALDNAGYLWVADSGNHTIRRIHLANRTVETVAGLAGSLGAVDGSGNEARFNAPLGIAFEPETLSGQLNRFISGAAPPAVRVIVADTGNGSVRRVHANGQVQTITPTASAAGLLDFNNPSIFALTTPPFDSPTGIAVDRFGTIYVSEPGKNQVKVILRTGEIVLLAQPNTSQVPKGLFIDELGQVLLAERGRGVQKITYGSPEITSVTPSNPVPGGQVTLKGVNFAPDSVTLAEGLPNDQPLLTVSANHSSFAVSPAVATLGAIGATTEFTADICCNIATVTGLTWESTEPDIATITPISSVRALATAKAPGTTTIRATFEGSVREATLTVSQTVSTIEISPQTPSFDALEQTLQLTAAAKDSQGNAISGKTFTWALASGTAITLSTSTAGLVTAVANGTATITASVDGVSGSKVVTVAQRVANVSVDPSSRTFTSIGQTQQFAAAANDSNGNGISGKTFTWESSSGGVASVNGTTGLATSVANGTSTITARVDGVSGTASITVAQNVSSVVVSPSNPTLTELGATLQFNAVAKDANGYDVPGRTFTWVSSAEGVATISSSGVATAVANGTSTITATTGTISSTTVLTVDQTASTVVASVTVSPSTKTLTALDSTHEFQAAAKNSAGLTLSGKTVTWSSSTPGVAVIHSATGIATAVANGTSTVTATVDGVTGTALLTVAQAVSSNVVSPASAVLTALGSNRQLTAAIKDANGRDVAGKTLIWSSSAPAVASVNSTTGVVTAVANGTATITAIVDSVAGTSIITVGQTVTSVAVTPGTSTLVSLGANRQFSAVARDANGNFISGKTFTWTSSAANIVTVNAASGLAVAVSNGTANITATVDGVSGTAALTVAQVVSTVSVSPTGIVLGVPGETQQFSAVARDANGNTITGKTFTWTSSATGIATINPAGLATAAAFGTTTITAAVDGVSGTASLSVFRKLLISNFRIVDTETATATVPSGLTGTITIGILNRSGAWPWVITPEGIR